MWSFTSLGISQFYWFISLPYRHKPLSVNLAKQLKAGTAGQSNSLFFVLNYGGRKSRHYKATLKGRDMSRVSSSWLVRAAQILISYGASHDLVRHQTQRPTFLFWHFFVAFFANIPLLWPVLAHHPEQLLNGCGVKPSLVQTKR